MNYLAEALEAAIAAQATIGAPDPDEALAVVNAVTRELLAHDRSERAEQLLRLAGELALEVDLRSREQGEFSVLLARAGDTAAAFDRLDPDCWSTLHSRSWMPRRPASEHGSHWAAMMFTFC
ncbi:hypothetical protein [Gordonia bronchialis]|uniref:hypothetical protein n=1 Tax=Gordonia bronchialis TaxID=2054 RepID=UPI00226FD59E|nr:hypothetical protein [Gordonia bronchialis]